MEKTFKFKIGLGYAPDIILTMEIPIKLHDRISLFVGDGQMARFEFGGSASSGITIRLSRKNAEI